MPGGPLPWTPEPPRAPSVYSLIFILENDSGELLDRSNGKGESSARGVIRLLGEDPARDAIRRLLDIKTCVAMTHNLDHFRISDARRRLKYALNGYLEKGRFVCLMVTAVP